MQATLKFAEDLGPMPPTWETSTSSAFMRIIFDLGCAKKVQALLKEPRSINFILVVRAVLPSLRLRPRTATHSAILLACLASRRPAGGLLAALPGENLKDIGNTAVRFRGFGCKV